MVYILIAERKNKNLFQHLKHMSMFLPGSLSTKADTISIADMGQYSLEDSVRSGIMSEVNNVSLVNMRTQEDVSV